MAPYITSGPNSVPPLHQKNEQIKLTQGADKEVKSFSPATITTIRIALLAVCFSGYIYIDIVQESIDKTWYWLLRQQWYHTVYFETLLPIFASFPIYIPIWIMDWFEIGEQYRIHGKGGKFDSETIPELIQHSLGYFISFAIIDTFHVKRFVGVSDEIIQEKRQHWVQVTRALPEYPPLFSDIIVHIIFALVVYDFLFFLQHYAMHKNAILYRVFHKLHHTHESVNAKVTDKLHPLERIALVLSANAGLKLVGAHPLTRTIFVFVLIFLLADNHSGYDFPWNYDKIIPFGIFAGSRRHYEHHENGARYYQPIFTYADFILERWRKYKNE